MIVATQQLRGSGARAPICIAVHALLADDAESALTAAGAGHIVSCNSVVHATNQIDLSSIIVAGVAPPRYSDAALLIRIRVDRFDAHQRFRIAQSVDCIREEKF